MSITGIITGIITNLITIPISFIIGRSYINRKDFKLLFKTLFRKYDIRMSMSYIYRIKVNDKYLLVKNTKFDYFQPVGGVYKIISEDKGYLKDTFNWSEDSKMEATGSKKNDLRGFIPAKNLLNFLKWFKTGKNREVSHWREFYEELIATNILSIKDFPYIEYRYADTLRTPLKFSNHFNCKEMLSYDVYDVILSKEQESILRNLQKEESDKYCWITKELIETEGYDSGLSKQVVKIGEHTNWTLNMKYRKKQ